MAAVFRVTRDLTALELEDAPPGIRPGDVLYEFRGVTYGCIRDGVAVSRTGPDSGPFYEVPWDAVEEIDASGAA